MSLTAFLSGAAVMVAEISAARAIAPHVGTSIVVWTNVIGIILVALALGYWIGGRIAERSVDPVSEFEISNLSAKGGSASGGKFSASHARGERLLGGIIAVAGALLIIPAFATAAIAGSLTEVLLQTGSGFLALLLGSFLLVVILFAFPIFLLGMVSPFLVKLASSGRTDTGAIAGRLYAISTVGSLVGTFLPTLILFPTIGTRRTILSAAAVLVVLGCLLLRRRAAIALALLPLALLVVPERPPSWFFGGRVVAAAESRYQYLRIIDAEDGERLLAFNEGLGVQSVAVDGDRIPDGYFTVTAALLALIERDPVRILILGNAGSTIGSIMQRLFPDRSLAITGVELDPAVTAITAAHFPPPLRPYPIIHADSRAFVRGARERYDVIVVDAYTNQLTIPAHLATREFSALLRDRLAPGGIVVANVNAPSEDSRLFRTIVQTIADVFPHVAEGPAGAWNRLIVASDRTVDVERLRAASLPASLLDPNGDLRDFLRFVRPVARDRAIRIFTDDWAPLELMTDIEVFAALRHR